MRLARLVFAALALAAPVPVLAAPCAGFTDVDDTSPAHAPFCANVEWIRNRGITLGCAPGLYCPDDPVTRLQMAAFLNRLGNVVFQQGGNAFGATAVLGTTDNHALDIRLNAVRAMRLEPHPVSPNLIGGGAENGVAPGVRGATIAGGGAAFGNDPDYWRDSGWNLAAGHYATISGGYGNVAGDTDAQLDVVGGGYVNTAAGGYSTIGGGYRNTALGIGSTVGGGWTNYAAGAYSTVSGGIFNEAGGQHTWAGGYRARASHHGTFVWAGAVAPSVFDQGFYSIADGEFALRATGGVRFVTQTDPFSFPTRTVLLNPNGELEFGNQTRQMLNLWGPGSVRHRHPVRHLVRAHRRGVHVVSPRRPFGYPVRPRSGRAGDDVAGCRRHDGFGHPAHGYRARGAVRGDQRSRCKAGLRECRRGGGPGRSRGHAGDDLVLSQRTRGSPHRHGGPGLLHCIPSRRRRHVDLHGRCRWRGACRDSGARREAGGRPGGAGRRDRCAARRARGSSRCARCDRGDAERRDGALGDRRHRGTTGRYDRHSCRSASIGVSRAALRAG